MSQESTFLGDFQIKKEPFGRAEEIISSFKSEEFRKKSEKVRHDVISEALLKLVREVTSYDFILIPVLRFIERVVEEKLVSHYSFSTFEVWLNQFSQINSEENLYIRGKMMGKWVPREEYQVFFPIGGGKMYPGSHLVTGHASADLDTTVASFWGWVDAFAAKVSDKLHIWNIPGGPPTSQIEVSLLFNDLFGNEVFDLLVKTRATLGLSSLDLMTQKGFLKKHPQESTVDIDHERTENAVVVVDKEGYYLGDWRNIDVEGVQQIILLFKDALHWFENNLHLELVSLFSALSIKQDEFLGFVKRFSQMKLSDFRPVNDYNARQKKHVSDFLIKVLNLSSGFDSTFDQFLTSMESLGLPEFTELKKMIDTYHHSDLFEKDGKLIEDRPRIFKAIAKIMKTLSIATKQFHLFIEQLEIALKIKKDVLGFTPQYVTHRSDADEIKLKMGAYPSLTVNYPDREGKLVPLGIIQSVEVHKTILGTASLRDFCNSEEAKIPPYIEVISVIDHHKSTLSTFTPPAAIIGDAQSSNVLVAERAFLINDRYSTGGMKQEEIKEQLAKITGLSDPELRLRERLIKKLIASQKNGPYYIALMREWVEYLQFVFAILDDTDLLSKVTLRDVECLASLINRMKSLMLRKEVEVVQFDDIERNEEFSKKAASRLLRNPDLYSLYRKVYEIKEKAVDENIMRCVKKENSNVFSDTKEQNKCARVGQTKLFARNFSTFKGAAPALRAIWCETSQHLYEGKNEIDLYLHMISTIASAEDQFAGALKEYAHQDELWIWIPETEQASHHLKTFLSAWRFAPEVVHNELEVEFLGNNKDFLRELFTESFPNLPEKKKSQEKPLPIAIIRFKAGTINSRKEMITPYLPVPI